jgi:hypothetical protein
MDTKANDSNNLRELLGRMEAGTVCKLAPAIEAAGPLFGNENCRVRWFPTICCFDILDSESLLRPPGRWLLLGRPKNLRAGNAATRTIFRATTRTPVAAVESTPS